MQWFQEFPFYQARHPPDVSGTPTTILQAAARRLLFPRIEPTLGNISSHLPSISVPCLTRYTLWLDELR